MRNLYDAIIERFVWKQEASINKRWLLSSVTSRGIGLVIWLLSCGIGFSMPQDMGASDLPGKRFRVEDIVERVLPSIAHIIAERRERDEFMEPTVLRKSGTGFLVDWEGHVLTNYHVVDGANRILVSLQGAQRRVAKLIGTDPMLDIALLRIDQLPKDLSPVVLYERSAFRLGQEVIVVGHPFTLHNTVTTGVISGLRRHVSPNALEMEMDLFQIDAALNPGNSGGPVLDRSGKVIGIVTAMFAKAQGIGFAVPIQEVSRILPDLKAYGHARRVWFGVMGTSIDEDTARLFQLPSDHGFLVETVHKRSPAERAGIKGGEKIISFAGHLFVLGGDIILAIDGEPIHDISDLVEAVKFRTPGEKIPMELLRNGEKKKVSLTLEIMPDVLIAVPATEHP